MTTSRRHLRSDQTVPGPVRNISVVYNAGDEHAVVSWDAPSFVGRPPITGYLLARDDGDGVEAAPWSDVYPADTRSLDFLYLKTGTYHFTVTPINARGQGLTTSRTLIVDTTVVPTAASSAGFTTLSFEDDFDSINTIDFVGTATAGKGYNWTVQQPFSNDPPAVTPDTTTVANSILTLTQNTNNLNQGIFTSNRVTCSHLVGPFQYGYYEARMKFDPSGLTSGWPSFWSIGATHIFLDNATRWPELDFFEFAPDSRKTSGGVFAASSHDHDAASGIDLNYWNQGNNTVDINPASWNEWHTYGCLWQQGSFKWYFDNTLIKTQTYTATTQTPTAISGTTGATAPAGTYTIYDDKSAGPASIILGTGIGCPLEVDWVRVWQ